MKLLGLLAICIGSLWREIRWSFPDTLSLAEQNATAPSLALNSPSGEAVVAWQSRGYLAKNHQLFIF